MRKEIDYSGTICYYNDLNQLHREDGPAIEDKRNNHCCWYINNKNIGCKFSNGTYQVYSYGLFDNERDFLKVLKMKAFW